MVLDMPITIRLKEITCWPNVPVFVVVFTVRIMGYTAANRRKTRTRHHCRLPALGCKAFGNLAYGSTGFDFSDAGLGVKRQHPAKACHVNRVTVIVKERDAVRAQIANGRRVKFA